MMSEVTQEVAGGQNKAVKLLVVVVLLAAASFGAYKFAAARSTSQANVKWAEAQAPQAGVNEFLPHTHPPGYVHPTGVVAGGTTQNGPVAAAPVGGPTKALVNIENAVACEFGGGATEPTVNGVTGKRDVTIATVSGGEKDYTGRTTPSVQKVSVTPGGGKFSPNVIMLKAGVPAEITFGQGTGCLNGAMSKDLGFKVTVINGAQTVALPGDLKKGTYQFSCTMGMICGVIVVS